MRFPVILQIYVNILGIWSNSNFALQDLTWAQFAGSAKVDTFKRSAQLVKKQITATISNILFVRGFFDEEDYERKSFEGLPLRILKAKSKNLMAKQVASWLTGAFDALEKRYLRKLKMVIYLDPDEPDQAYEVYSIKVSYPEGSPALDVDGLVGSTKDLLKTTLELTEGFDSLPNTKYLSFRMEYYDEDTPADYEPPGFERNPGNLVLPEGTRNLRAGSVLTSFHKVGVKVNAKPGVVQSPDHLYPQMESSQGSQLHVVS